MNRIINILIKIIITFIIIYLAGLLTLVLKGEVNPNKPLPSFIGILTIILIIILWRVTFYKTENGIKVEKTILKNRMYNKYRIIIDSFTEEPNASVTEANEDSITIEYKSFTYSRYIILEKGSLIEIEWYADFGQYGKRENKWTFRHDTQQITILKNIREYMAKNV